MLFMPLKGVSVIINVVAHKHKIPAASSSRSQAGTWPLDLLIELMSSVRLSYVQNAVYALKRYTVSTGTTGCESLIHLLDQYKVCRWGEYLGKLVFPVSMHPLLIYWAKAKPLENGVLGNLHIYIAHSLNHGHTWFVSLLDQLSIWQIDFAWIKL